MKLCNVIVWFSYLENVQQRSFPGEKIKDFFQNSSARGPKKRVIHVRTEYAFWRNFTRIVPY